MKNVSTTMIKKVMIASLCIILTSCNLFNPQEKSVKIQKSALVIINDVSGSIKLTDSDLEKEKVWLKKYCHSNFKSQSDVALLSINSTSNSALNIKWFNWKSPEKKKTEEFQSETDKILEASNEENDNLIQKAQIQKQFFEQLKIQSQIKGADQSEIIELMPLLQKETEKYDSVQIVFISDMCQSGNKRTFNSQTLQSKQKAEQDAREDAKAIAKEFSLSESTLQKVISISILVPTQANDTYEVLPFYYDEFFRYFGYIKPIIWESL